MIKIIHLKTKVIAASVENNKDELEKIFSLNNLKDTDFMYPNEKEPFFSFRRKRVDEFETQRGENNGIFFVMLSKEEAHYFLLRFNIHSVGGENSRECMNDIINKQIG